MEISMLSTQNQQQTLSFPPTLYQLLTLKLPEKEVIIDVRTGAVSFRETDQPRRRTLDLVREFQQFQQFHKRAPITIHTYRAVLVALSLCAPFWPPTADDINALLDDYEARKRSPVTVSEYRTRIGAFCKWAIQYGHLNINPMEWVPPRKMPKPHPGVIRPQDFVKVIRFLEDLILNTSLRQANLPHERAIRDLAIIRFAYSTGCRVSEVVGLDLRDLYLEDRMVLLRPAIVKGNKKREPVYFGRQAAKSLTAWLALRDTLNVKSAQLFLGTRGNGWSKTRFQKSGVYQAWRGWQSQAQIGPYRFHDIRHSHITRALDLGVGIHHVSEQAGHASPEITLRIYTHSQSPERRLAYENKNPDDHLTVQ
jgi:integrase/recombinase XerC